MTTKDGLNCGAARQSSTQSAYLKRVDAIAAAHAILHPALVIEAGAISGKLLRGNLENRDVSRYDQMGLTQICEGEKKGVGWTPSCTWLLGKDFFSGEMEFRPVIPPPTPRRYSRTPCVPPQPL